MELEIELVPAAGPLSQTVSSLKSYPGHSLGGLETHHCWR